MNPLSYDLAISALGIKGSPTTIKKNDKGQEVIEYNWEGFKICNLEGESLLSTNVEGPIPLEVAQKIYDEYPDRIRRSMCPEKGVFSEDGKMIDFSPKAVAKDGIIDAYMVENFDGLIILLTELQDYKARKEGKELNPSAQVRQKELRVKIYKRMLLEASKFKITPEEWIEAHDARVLAETRNRKGDAQDRRIRELLNEFDMLANPMANRAEFAPVAEWAEDVRMRLTSLGSGHDVMYFNFGGENSVGVACDIMGYHPPEFNNGFYLPRLAYECGYDGNDRSHIYNTAEGLSKEEELWISNGNLYNLTTGRFETPEFEDKMMKDLIKLFDDPNAVMPEAPMATSEQKQMVIAELEETNTRMRQIYEKLTNKGKFPTLDFINGKGAEDKKPSGVANPEKALV